ncbi:hypothetical protein ACQ4PT_041663 [Festuca glaucescens]
MGCERDWQTYSQACRILFQEILESIGPFVDGLKFSGGSHSLMGKELIREITDLAHKHEMYVSTGDWAEHLLRQGPSSFKQYVEECKELGFDTIELNAGSLKLPEEAILRLVRLIKSSAPVKQSSERVEDVDLLIRRAERCLEAGADMIMIDADDVCQHTDSLRADIVAKIVGRLGLEKTMFETSNANTSEWFVKRYGPRVNLFADHTEVMNLERLRGFDTRRGSRPLLTSPFFLGDPIIENLEVDLREEAHPIGGSSHSRSPIRKSERRHNKKKVDDEKTDSTGSLNSSDNEDRKKDDRHSSGNEKDDIEAQLKQIALDMKTLHEDKSKVQMILDQKIDEAGILSTKVDDLELQLNKEKQDCERSQGRFERLADSLASDSLKSGTKEQGYSVNAGNDDPYYDYEMSPYDQRQKHGLTAGKRSTALSASEEDKSGKKRRVNGDDMIHMSGKYIPEDALESFKNSNETDTPKSLSMKKLGEGDNNDERNVISSHNDFTDRYNGNGEEDHVDV